MQVSHAGSQKINARIDELFHIFRGGKNSYSCISME